MGFDDILDKLSEEAIIRASSPEALKAAHIDAGGIQPQGVQVGEPGTLGDALGVAQEAPAAAPAATGITPDQASTYSDVNFGGGQTDAQKFAEAMQQFGQKRQLDLSPTGSYSQDEIGRQMQAQVQPELSAQGANLMTAQQAPEAFNVMQGAQAGLPLQANMPTPLRPAVAPTSIQPELSPTESVAQEEAQRQVVAQQVAQRQAAQEVAQAKAQHAQNIDKAAADRVATMNQQQQGKDWGSIVGQGLAVALGELGRHMTGGGENLALKTIERLANEKAAKEKLSAEQSLAAKKMALDVAQLKLKEEELKTGSQLKRAQIGKIGMEMQKAAQEVAMKQNVMARLTSGQGFTAEELQILPEKDRSRAVVLPDGNYKLAVSPQRAKDTAIATDAASQASGQIKELLELADYFGNNPAKKLLSREEISRAKSTQMSLRGNLRTLIVGPGNVSTYEHELLNNVVRDPTAFFSLNSANKAALEQLLHKTQAAQRRAYKSAGIQLAPSVNDINIQKLRQQAPSMSEKQAEDILIKTGQWKEE